MDLMRVKSRWVMVGVTAFAVGVAFFLMSNGQGTDGRGDQESIVSMAPPSSATIDEASRFGSRESGNDGAQSIDRNAPPAPTEPDSLAGSPSPEKIDLRAEVARLSEPDPIGFAAALRKMIDDDDSAGRLDAETSYRIGTALRTTSTSDGPMRKMSSALERVRCSQGICEVEFTRLEGDSYSASELQRSVQRVLTEGSGEAPLVYYRTGRGFDPDKVVIFVFFDSAQLPAG